MAKQAKAYDYGKLAGKPNVASFYLGWLGQKIAECVYSYGDTHGRGHADEATNEIYRIMVVANAAFGQQLESPPEEVRDAMDVIHCLLSEEWWSADEWLREQALLDPSVKGDTVCLVPRFLMGVQPTCEVGRSLLNPLDKIVRAIVTSESQLPAARAGSILCRVIYNTGTFGPDIHPQLGPVDAPEAIRSLTGLNLIDPNEPWMIQCRCRHEAARSQGGAPTPTPPPLPTSYPLPEDLRKRYGRDRFPYVSDNLIPIFKYAKVAAPPVEPDPPTLEAGKELLHSPSWRVVERKKWDRIHGWGFDGNAFEFKGCGGSLPPLPMAVLKRLVQGKGRPVREDALCKIWEAQDKEPPAHGVKDTVSTVRKALRRAFDLRDGEQPVPNVGEGSDRSWRVDMELLTRAAARRGPSDS